MKNPRRTFCAEFVPDYGVLVFYRPLPFGHRKQTTECCSLWECQRERHHTLRF